jgi:hypothetical protein
MRPFERSPRRTSKTPAQPVALGGSIQARREFASESGNRSTVSRGTLGGCNVHAMSSGHRGTRPKRWPSPSHSVVRSKRVASSPASQKNRSTVSRGTLGGCNVHAMASEQGWTARPVCARQRQPASQLRARQPHDLPPPRSTDPSHQGIADPRRAAPKNRLTRPRSMLGVGRQAARPHPALVPTPSAPTVSRGTRRLHCRSRSELGRLHTRPRPPPGVKPPRSASPHPARHVRLGGSFPPPAPRSSASANWCCLR